MKHGIFLFFLMASLLQAQKIQTFTSDKPSAFINEIGGIAVKDNGRIVFNRVMPKESRAKEYQFVGIQEGDEILFLNGKRINSIDELKQFYTAIKKGDNVKLGIARKEKKFFVEFKKGDAPLKEFTGGSFILKRKTSGADSVKKQNR